MSLEDGPEIALDASEFRRLRGVLEEHGVGLALLFGSAARPEGTPGDVDVAVEFEAYRPADDGYAATYLNCYTALDDELEGDVDLVDVHTMSPAFAAVVFETGVLVVGTDDRRASLERRLADERPSLADARERVAAAAGRLRKWSS